MPTMRPFILLAAIALFSHTGRAQQPCRLATPSRLFIDRDNTFRFQIVWSHNFPCYIKLMALSDETEYGSTTCQPSRGFCYMPLLIPPECDESTGTIPTTDLFLRVTCTNECPETADSEEFNIHDFTPVCRDLSRTYIACGSKDICEVGKVSTGPGCYCTNGQYLYQGNYTCVDPSTFPGCIRIPTTSPSVNLFVDPCIEAARPLAITWNPQTYPINRYEVRDSTGDLVASDTVAAGADRVTIESPPVGIYEVTVFGVDDSGTQFNESARFITKEENIVQDQFRVFALPNVKGVTACFSSGLKDVSYMCQEDSGDKQQCKDCASYSRDNGIGSVTIYMQAGGVDVLKQSFEYRV